MGVAGMMTEDVDHRQVKGTDVLEHAPGQEVQGDREVHVDLGLEKDVHGQETDLALSVQEIGELVGDLQGLLAPCGSQNPFQKMRSAIVLCIIPHPLM